MFELMLATLIAGAAGSVRPATAAKPAPTRVVKGKTAKPATPLTNPGTWVNNDDYPERANRESREGTTGFVLDISAEGLPTGCRVTQSSGHDDLDVTTCVLVQSRARFDPATDRRGRPVLGNYSNRVRWQLPNASAPFPNMFADGMKQSWFTIQADGRVTGCSVAEPGFRTPCDFPNVRYEPFRDAAGNAVARRVRMNVFTRTSPVISGGDGDDGQTQEQDRAP